MLSILNRHLPTFRTLYHVQRLNCSKMSERSGEVDLRSMRTPYKDDTDVLLEDNLPTKDPIELFKIWFEDAKKCPTIKEPNAVCLTTSTRSVDLMSGYYAVDTFVTLHQYSFDRNGIPSSRMVLLKAFGSAGFKIFTNLSSRKGSEMVS